MGKQREAFAKVFQQSPMHAAVTRAAAPRLHRLAPVHDLCSFPETFARDAGLYLHSG